MPHHTDLPLVRPGGRPRPLTPAELLRLAQRRPVPGLVGDPRAEAIGRLAPGNEGWLDFGAARRRGYLVLTGAPHRRDGADLAAFWGWWCAAGRLPELVVDLRGGRGEAGVRLDLSPAGLALTPAAMLPLGRACAEWAVMGGWIASPDTVEVAAPGAEAAHGLAAALLRVADDRALALPVPARPGAARGSP